MLKLTDTELDIVLRAAKPLDVRARDAFLQEVAGLAALPERGDGAVYRVVAEIQRRHWHPPYDSRPQPLRDRLRPRVPPF
jgi:hypothetical protein